MGSEVEMVEFIFENLEVIEFGFKLLFREKVIGIGIVDVFGRDSDGNIVVFEFKCRRVEFYVVRQFKSYVEILREEYGDKVCGIFVVFLFIFGVKRFLEKEGFEFRKFELFKRDFKKKGRQKILFQLICIFCGSIFLILIIVMEFFFFIFMIFLRLRSFIFVLQMVIFFLLFFFYGIFMLSFLVFINLVISFFVFVLMFLNGLYVRNSFFKFFIVFLIVRMFLVFLSLIVWQGFFKSLLRSFFVILVISIVFMVIILQVQVFVLFFWFFVWFVLFVCVFFLVVFLLFWFFGGEVQC